MSIIVRDNHNEIAEVEFIGRHPDTFSSSLAAQLTLALAEEHTEEQIEQYRADINVQSLGELRGEDPWVRINIGGQLQIPNTIDFQKIAKKTAISTLSEAGYLRNDFSIERVTVDTSGTTGQAPELRATTQENKFADSCVVYGHYIAPPHGIHGTFASLGFAQQIDETVRQLQKTSAVLRPDGKVHVIAQHTKNGPIAREVYLSIAHARKRREEAIQAVKESLALLPALLQAKISVNAGGDFDTYFLKADSGVSKAKDDVIITGGIHQLGTDRVWGKCLYKASSTLIPYGFSLSRAICDATGARYACVSAASQYGQRDALLQLQDIDPLYELLRSKINAALSDLPRDRNAIRDLIGLPVSKESYRLFNDVRGFHKQEKPWKKRNKTIIDALRV